MDILNFNSLGSLSARSASAIESFTKTVEKLKKVNKDSQEVREKNNTEIIRLGNENTELASVEAQNSKIIAKIESIIS